MKTSFTAFALSLAGISSTMASYRYGKLVNETWQIDPKRMVATY